MGSLVVAGIGGLLFGHILWLLTISAVRDSPSSSTWVLLIAAVVAVAAAASGYLARQRYQRGELEWSAFLGALPVAPVVFTLIVLGVTYL